MAPGWSSTPGGRDTTENRDPESVGGSMVWSHKTAPEPEIRQLKEAEKLWKQAARLGAGVTRVLAEKRAAEPTDGGGDGFGQRRRSRSA